MISTNTHAPWLCLGDFNTVLFFSERISSSAPKLSDLADFAQCLHSCSLSDLHHTGEAFTWSNRQDQGDRVCSKLDRVLNNYDFLLQFPHTTAQFIYSSISDHFQALVSLHKVIKRQPKPFKFL